VPLPRSRLPGRARLALLGTAAVVFVLYPLALVATASPLRGPQPRGYVVDGLLRTVDPSLNLTATVSGGRVVLRWNPAEPAGTRVFYRIWRSNAPNGGASCTPAANAPDDCELVMDDLGAHPGGAWVDRPGTGTWTYRLGLAANWLDSPDYGDVYSIGPPVTVRVR